MDCRQVLYTIVAFNQGDTTMATIEKRDNPDGKISYRVKVRLKGFEPQTATFARLTDARRWAAQTESAIREGRYFQTTEAKRHTLGEAIDRYLTEVMPRKSKGSIGAQKGQLLWWQEQLGCRTLADITPPLIAEYRDRLAREPIPSPAKDEAKAGPPRYRSNATVKMYLLTLSHLFTVAVKEWSWLEANPLERVNKPKLDNARVRFLDDDERGRLLTACQESESPDLHLAVVLALATGCRKMESMGLRWKQVDFSRKQITLTKTKNGETRTVPLSGLALDLLRERSKVRRIDTDLIFPAHNPASAIDLRTPFETALRVAGIENFHWHDLRHSTASYLAMNGASMLEIAAVLGHKTLAMVKRYSHLSEQHTAGVLESMNSRMFG